MKTNNNDNITMPKRNSPHQVGNELVSSEPKQHAKKKRKRRGIFVAMKDVPIMLLKEEFVRDMVPKLRFFAAMKDAPIKHRMEEFVSDMVPKLRFAAMKDVPIKQRMEKFVSGTVHHGQKRLVAIKDVPNMCRME